MKTKRIMIAATASGSGKTMITCGLLCLLRRKQLRTASVKCGPDFIDPMFHSRVIGVPGRNLDTFLTPPDVTRYLLAKNTAGADLALLEGVMGYYDGLGFESSRAGSSDLAAVTKTPVILVLPAKGMSRSILPVIRGFLDYDKDSCIRGVLLNRISPMIYPRMKQMIEQETGVPVLGFLPVMDDIRLESRHLGLVLPGEIRDLQNSLNRLADQMEKTVDLEGLLAIANTAPPLSYSESFVRQYLAAGDTDKGRPSADGPACPGKEEKVRVGIADDEAFCFHYRDNLDLLREMGAEIVPFSPLKDPQLPGQIRALILPGGYPELYAKELSENSRMLHSIAATIRGGLPTIAECGGFLYLHKTLAAPDGPSYPAVGLYPWASRYTGHLSRFGYITLTDSIFFGVRVGDVRAHEFHYYESENPGDAFLAVKPTGNRSWRCGYSTSTLYAGFPHLYYYANPKVAAAFLDAAARKR